MALLSMLIQSMEKHDVETCIHTVEKRSRRSKSLIQNRFAINYCMTLGERIKNTVKTKGFAYKECLGVDLLCCLIGKNAVPGACVLRIQGKRRRKRHGQSKVI